MQTITKEWLQEQQACTSGIRWFLRKKETESVKVLEALIQNDKLNDANWLITRVMDRPSRLKYAIFAAEQVLHIFEKKYPNDTRPRLAIEAAKKVLESDTEENRAYAAACAHDADVVYVDRANTAYASADDAAANAARAARAAARAAAAAARAAYDDAYTAYAYARAAYAYARKTMKIKILNYGIGLLKEAQLCQTSKTS